MDFSYPKENYTCSASQAERELSKEMISLWTAMTENGKPSTEAIQWPRFKTTSSANTPGMVFGNSSASGNIDFSICKLWAKVGEMLDGGNITTSKTDRRPAAV